MNDDFNERPTPPERPQFVRPPRPSPRPDIAPSLPVEPKTNPGGLASNAYVKKKVRQVVVRGSVVGAVLSAAVTAFGMYLAHEDSMARLELREMKLLLQAKDAGP